jgi:hypothetical protein
MKGHVEAAAGYHCDGCSAAEPEYRCGPCDFDLCAACWSGFCGRGEGSLVLLRLIAFQWPVLICYAATCLRHRTGEALDAGWGFRCQLFPASKGNAVGALSAHSALTTRQRPSLLSANSMQM